MGTQCPFAVIRLIYTRRLSSPIVANIKNPFYITQRADVIKNLCTCRQDLDYNYILSCVANMACSDGEQKEQW